MHWRVLAKMTDLLRNVPLSDRGFLRFLGQLVIIALCGLLRGETRCRIMTAVCAPAYVRRLLVIALGACLLGARGLGSGAVLRIRSGQRFHGRGTGHQSRSCGMFLKIRYPPSIDPPALRVSCSVGRHWRSSRGIGQRAALRCPVHFYNMNLRARAISTF